MKKTLCIFAATAALVLAAFQTGCSTTTTRNSHAMAAQGNTKLTYDGFASNKTALKSAVVLALQQRKWTVVSAGDPVVAEINHGGQNAKVSVETSDGKIVFETKGSNIDGNPYVPIRYVDMLMKTVRRNLGK